MGLFIGIFLEMLGGSAPIHSKGDQIGKSLVSGLVAAGLVVCLILTVAALSASA
jgi:hypothetical protein